MHPTIEAMARRFYEALAGGIPSKPWSQLNEAIKEAYCDAMWQALKELRMAPDDVLEAAIGDGSSRTQAAVQAEYASGRRRSARKIKMADRWTCAIDKLLEVR